MSQPTTSAKIDAARVAHVAKLARLSLSAAECERYADQLTQILSYAERLRRAPTEGVAPLSNPNDVVNVTRPDEVAPSIGVAAALANAPQKHGSSFRVPAVLEGGA